MDFHPSNKYNWKFDYLTTWNCQIKSHNEFSNTFGNNSYILQLHSSSKYFLVCINAFHLSIVNDGNQCLNATSISLFSIIHAPLGSDIASHS
ncbi:MAG: hypothetical protein K0S47_4772 [Herbinix sp.]|nr:hypothetical protein [Herbinix sp.]